MPPVIPNENAAAVVICGGGILSIRTFTNFTQPLDKDWMTHAYHIEAKKCNPG